MKEFFDHIFLSNSIRDYAIVACIILLAYLMKKFVGKYVSRLLFFFVRQFGLDIDREAFTKLVLGPIENFLFLLIAYVALINLRFPELFFYKFLKNDTKNIAETVGTAIIILTFFTG